MGILNLIASILKAVPILGRLFVRFADDKRELKAQERYEEKLNLIDSAVDKYHRAGVHDSGEAQQQSGTNAAPAVPKGSVSRSRVHKASAKNDSGTGVPARKKKVAKKKAVKKKTAKRKVSNAKEKRPTTRRSGRKRIQQAEKNTKSQN